MRLSIAVALGLFANGLGCAPTAALSTGATMAPTVIAAARSPLAQDRLDNGLTVTGVADHRDWFEAGLFFSGGPLLDPADRAGLTGWMVHAALIATEGDPTPSRPPAARALELGVMLLPVTHGNLFGWVAYGPSEARASALELLADVAMRPTFPATELQVRGARERQRIATTDESELGTLVAVAVGHALGLDRPVRLDATTALFDTLNREDVVRHWRRWVRPEHATLVVTGRPELGQRWSSWRNLSEVPPPPRTCVPHGQSAHLVLSNAEMGGDVLVILAAAVPGLGSRERADLSGWFGWLGERPGGPIEALVGAQQARRLAPTIIDLATGPGRSLAVVISGSRGPSSGALSDMDVASQRLHMRPEAVDREGVHGGLVAARADTVMLREQPITRLVATAEDTLYGPVEVTADVDAAALTAERTLAPWRYTFAGLGQAAFEAALEGIAPVTRWTASGDPLGGAQPRRCEPLPPG